MKEYEGKIKVKLSAGVSVEGENREDAKRKLERLHERLVKFLESEGMVDEVYAWGQESYVYTDENWKPTPLLDDERYLVYENGGDREYYEEYYDGDETRIEDAIEASEEAERELLKEIEVDEIYFKERFRYKGEDYVSYRNVRKKHWLCSCDESEPSSDGDLVDAMFAYGEDEVEGVKIYVNMKTGALIYDFGMRNYELVEAEKYWERNSDDDYECEYRNERKLGPKVYAHFMGQDAADKAFKHLNEGIETNA